MTEQIAQGEYTVLAAFDARDDLKVYGDNALLLYTLALKHEIDDIQSVADRALTDGPEDKKCDLVYVDVEFGVAVIAQGYFAQKPKAAAKTQKAQDLNTAVTWLLTRSLSDLPDSLRPAAGELRDAIEQGKINKLEIWYSHNLPESLNVKSELSSVVQTASNALLVKFPGKSVNVEAQEIGLDTLEELYKRLQSSILVTDSFEISVPGGYIQNTEKWEAYNTSIPVSWLYNIYKEHEEKLFSANIRGYLGSRQSDANINNGIKKSAKERPENFWAFNNGVTALVHRFEVVESKKKLTLEIEGLSIVNGAQTTGAIGSLSEEPAASAYVPARFIKCSDSDLIEEIIRFNNSQNKIEAADFRSTDDVQKRLRNEFEAYREIEYSGGRRGGAEDIIRRRPTLISSYTVAQALTAFHGNAVLAYNGKSEIWKSDAAYSRVFNDGTHADHVLFVYSLLDSITGIKTDLMSREKEGENLAEADKAKLLFLRTRGANYLLVTAVSKCLETILDTSVANKFDLRFVTAVRFDQYKTTWQPVLKSCMAFHSQLKKPLANSLRSNEEVNEAIELLRSLIESVRNPNAELYDSFSDKVISTPRV